MSETAIFVRLLDAEDKGAELATAVTGVRSGDQAPRVFVVDLLSLERIPESPFAYWATTDVLTAFMYFSPFEGPERHATKGLATTDDFQFARAWWEVQPTRVARPVPFEIRSPGVGVSSCAASFGDRAINNESDPRWVGFSKGGARSRFYLDPHLVVDWENEGARLKRFLDEKIGQSGQWSRWINAVDYYLQPGVTWSRRTQGGFTVRVLPANCIFSDKGPSAFDRGGSQQNLLSLLSIMNSSPFRSLLELQMAFGSYEVGVVQRTPVPPLADADLVALADLGRRAFEKARSRDIGHEVAHTFMMPTLARHDQSGIASRLTAIASERVKIDTQLARLQAEIDDRVRNLYRFKPADLALDDTRVASADGAKEFDEDESDATELDTPTMDVENLLMYALGAILGRWDVRIALDRSLAPKLQGPFDPLPICSPGMLVGPDGLPATRNGIVSEDWLRARPDAISLPSEGGLAEPIISDAAYPLRVDWDGILVDDEGHPDDVVARVRDVFTLLWGDRAEAIEREACGILSVPDLREYFRNPRRFWEFHVKRYSKSRRKAPIYWLLQSPKRNYGLWVYYHRLDPDILFKALMTYVEPKLRLEEDRLRGLEAQRQATGAGSETKRLEKTIDQQEALLSDLHEFRDQLDRAARLHLRPDLDDGVILNIAPLHELVPWKEAKGMWNELLAGKYAWSSIGKQLREKGLV